MLKEWTIIGKNFVLIKWGILIFMILLLLYSIISPHLQAFFFCILFFQILVTGYYLTGGRKGFLYAAFQFSFFLFLMGRYLVSIVFNYSSGYGGIFESGYSDFTVKKIFLTYLLSLISIQLAYGHFDNFAASLHKKYPSNIKFTAFYNKINTYFASQKRSISKISIFLFLIAGIFKIDYYFTFSKYVESVGYFESYLTNLPNYPTLFYLASRSFEITFFVLIALRPKLTLYFFYSSLFLIISATELSTGRRMQFMQSFLIVIVFFAINYWNGIRKKTKKILVLGMLLGVPLLIIILQSIAFYRSNSNIEFNLAQTILKFFYDQGISTRVVGNAILEKNSLPNKGYSIGPIIDLFNSLFGIPVPARSSVESALSGYVLSDALSYLQNPQAYRNGVSLGSSYIAELFVDLGWIGIAIGSLVYGVIFRFFERGLSSRNILVSIVFILISRELIIAPRSQYLKFLFGISPTNLILLGIVIFLLVIISHIISLKHENSYQN